ncbi:ATP-dependent zinc metalloprotease FTSH, chloroplastic-like protein [Tanacetum coccineum]|uniref:ATP-dependent zinc metalloprotease FTSH, chloroplastic-like protein n=1 Tax=Tanacetum coccineum TaxID=301880 RepID=A0ABQ5DSW2_9ASTR
MNSRFIVVVNDSKTRGVIESTNNLLRKRCNNMLDVNSVDLDVNHCLKNKSNKMVTNSNYGISVHNSEIGVVNESSEGELKRELENGMVSDEVIEFIDGDIIGEEEDCNIEEIDQIDEKGDEKSDRKHDETGDGKTDEFVHFDGKREDLELLDENGEGFELLENRSLDFVKLVEAACDDKLDEVIVGGNDLESNESSEVEVKREKAESVEKCLSGIQMDACGKMESEKVLNKIEPLFYVLQHVKESMRKIGINGLHTEIGATRGMERILDTIKENHMASDQPLAKKFVKDRGKKNGSKSDVIEVNEKEVVKASQKAERAKNDSMSGYEFFLADASLFVDDVEAYENYPKGENPVNSKQEAQESSSISGSSTYKSKAPGVVYIDEFDSVERQKGAGLGCGNKVTEQTFHHFLLEIDRLSGNTKVYVGDTTNRPDDVIGSSLLRPRRFSRYLSVELAMWNWRKRLKPSGRNCKFKRRKLNFDVWKWPVRKKDGIKSGKKLLFCWESVSFATMSVFPQKDFNSLLAAFCVWKVDG